MVFTNENKILRYVSIDTGIHCRLNQESWLHLLLNGPNRGKPSKGELVGCVHNGCVGEDVLSEDAHHTGRDSGEGLKPGAVQRSTPVTAVYLVLLPLKLGTTQNKQTKKMNKPKCTALKLFTLTA